jgi:hypothetical protein
MIKFHEIRVGDLVLAAYNGNQTEGVVLELDHEDKLVNVQTGDQENFYTPENLFPILVDDQQLKKFNFEKLVNPDESVKYMRGPFRILLPKKDQFDNFEIWYREDRRHIAHPLGVHELQNHYHQMTKVDLMPV